MARKEKKLEANKVFSMLLKFYERLDLFNKILMFMSIFTIILYLLMQTQMIGYLLTIILIMLVYYFKKLILSFNFDKIMLISSLIIVSIFVIFITNTPFNKNKHTPSTKSSVVSYGVNLDDLGNIVNGQYFFDDGNKQYYSTFDQNGRTHIYVTDKKNNATKTIFDGFGWSFVAKDGYLYFSGNAGETIDATYKLYRIVLSSSKLELLNNNYTYNMNFYRDYIYYIRQANHDAEIASIYRSNLDGSNEEEIVANTSGLSVIYLNKLYYLDIEGYIYSANPDGTNNKKIIEEEVNYFIIGQGKIIYIDKEYNIKSSSITGTDLKIIRNTNGLTIYKLNSYKDKLFYVVPGSYLSDRRAYNYMVYSIDLDGKYDKLVYSGVSWGYYINVLNNKLYVLDYAQDLEINKFIAITRSMNLDGSNIQDLKR